MKRAQEDQQPSGKRPKHHHELNTTTDLEPNGTITEALGELLHNAFQTDPTATYKLDDRTLRISNQGTLKRKHFTFSSQSTPSGTKSSYGLKQACAVLK